ncbi:MAG: hypothetical protein V1886_02450 [archaeon]
MSDALTDISYDQRRGENYNSYMRNLRDYLTKPSKKSFKILLKSAESTDAVPRGYFGGSTSIAEGLEEKIKNLQKKDKREWANLLSSSDSYSYYNDFKRISPFADKTLVFVDYGCGFVHIHFDEFENKIHDRIRNSDYKTYDADKYLAALPISSQQLEEIIGKADVVWMRCGIYSGKTGEMLAPRNAEGKPRGEHGKN